MLALAALFSSTSLAQDATTAETLTGARTLGLSCATDATDPACATAGQFKPSFDIQHEFDGYYTETDSKR
jgi:hypothetical protein